MTNRPTVASDGHVRKRPFQPSITSYFHAHGDDGYDRSSPPLQSSHSSISPPLPAETQSSLLSVGMRVRKSVPEGYKTHKTIPVSVSSYARGTPLPTSSAPARDMASSSSTVELMPFCGLHKIGGWSMQEVPSSSAPATLEAGDFLAMDYGGQMPGLSSSQGTLPSTQGSLTPSLLASAPATRKRTFEEEVEDDLDAYFEGLDSVDHSHDYHLSSERPIARMRAPGQKLATHAPAATLTQGDFEDAVFLAPMDLDDVS